MGIKKIVAIAASMAISGAALAESQKGDTMAEPQKSAAMPEQQKNIVDTAVQAGNFKTLVTALTAAGLVDTLKGPGPYTVFAPTDEAFAKLPPGALDSLLKDKEKLKGVLLYHVVPGKVLAKDVMGMKTAKTAQGDSIAVRTVGEKVMINQAGVVKTDILASNGVIHVIDAVIMPNSAPTATN